MKQNNELPKSISYLRWMGILYLLVIILAGFSQGYVRGSIIIPGDASATADNIMNQIDLFRLGLSTDLTAFIIDAVISVMLYQVFKTYNKNLAMIMASLRLLAHPAIASINLINHYFAYKVLEGDRYLTAFTAEQLDAFSLFFADGHRYGYLIAGAFFGIHLLLLAILIYKTPVFPSWLGGLILGSSAGYIIESYGNFSFPGNEAWMALLVGVTAAIGELALTLYLLIKGGSTTYFKQLNT